MANPSEAHSCTFLHIGRFSAYSKQPCSAQEHSQADHCKGYRNSTATHVSPADSCLTERETYLEPPISGGRSPAGWRQLYVSDIKPYGCHSRRGHRRTACFHTPLVKPKRGPTARTCTHGRCTFRLPSRRWRWPDRSGRTRQRSWPGPMPRACCSNCRRAECC